MRIGIYGGTFNPPHLGHKHLALQLKDRANLDKIIIIPTFVPPHKNAEAVADGKHRLEMCKLLFTESFFEISDIELKREGKSYTYDTLCELKVTYPEDELFLIMGSDMLLCFDSWYRYMDILNMVTLCAASRGDADFSVLEEYARTTLNLDTNRNEIVISNIEPMKCTSSEIRYCILYGGKIVDLVSSEIDRYIKLNLIYDTPFLEYKKLLRKKLDDFRFYHSLNVAESAKELAFWYGESKEDSYLEKAYLAGLLHDCMKNADKNEMLQMIKKGGIILNRVEQNNPKLWHAIAGSVFVQSELNITDIETVNAIRYHTTGRAGMSTFEKIIYIADYISLERDYPDVDTMRLLSETKGLDEAALYSLQYSLKSLSKKKALIHNDSLEFYNELILNLNQR